MELGQLLADGETEVKVDWNGHAVMVTFDANAYTPKLEGEMRSAVGRDDEGQARAVVELLAKVLVSWDITDSGKPFECSADHLETMPLGFLLGIFEGMAKEMGEVPLSGATSDVP